MNTAEELQSIYAKRFERNLAYRRKVWEVLVADFFSRYVGREGRVLDLGCGYGEFINGVECREKWAMDLNPDAPRYLAGGVRFIEQDCSKPWGLEAGSLDVVFTSNFFEHLPSKAALRATLIEARRCLVSGGRIVMLGPNIRLLQGAYWDFWDHHIALSDRSLVEGLENCGFRIAEVYPAFLPYTMAGGVEYPMAFVKLYLALRPAWRWFGKQFLIVAEKP